MENVMLSCKWGKWGRKMKCWRQAEKPSEGAVSRDSQCLDCSPWVYDFDVEKKNLQLYKRVHMWIQFQGTVCHFGSVWKMSVLITEPCCRLFLQNRENNNMDNWKWMQFWTDIAEGISHYRTQINGTKSRGWRHWLFTMYIGKYYYKANT